MTEPDHSRASLLARLRELHAATSGTGGAAGQSEQAWRSSVGAAPQYLLLLDDELNFRFVNRLRPGRPGPVGRNVFEFLPEQYHRGLRTAIDDARATGRPQYFELEADGPGGQTSWFSNWVMPMSDPTAPDGLAVIAMDVTDQVRTERALESEKSVLQSLITHAPDHILIVDRDHRVQFRNRDELGLSADRVIDHTLESQLPAEFHDAVHAAIEQVFATGEPSAYDIRAETSDGWRWYSTRVGPVFSGATVDRVSLISTDITERVEQAQLQAVQQQRLRESQERFRTLVEHAPEAVVILDVDSNHFIDANSNACTLFGTSRQALLQWGPEQVSPLYQPDGTLSSDGVRAHVADALDGRPVVFEWIHQDATGEPVACEVRLVRLPDQQRRLIRGSIIDISDRRRAEAERERLTHELSQSQKMQAIGQLTGGVAHDFNNLLTVIMSGLEMIDGDADDPARVRGLTRHALAAAERAAALIQQLLAFARRQPLRPQVIDLNRLVADAEHLLRRTLDETITIETVLGGGLWPCETDPAQLESVVLNLAINARDAMPRGGQLTIETGNARLDRHYAEEHEDVNPGQYVMLAVSDNGNGMEPGVLRQVFEPFFTTKPTGEGSGLGLSMVYGFVKQSGGHVKIYSELGEGTTVKIYLPRTTSNTETTALRRTPEVTPGGDGQRVLVVEDHPGVRALVVEELESLGYRAVDAEDAHQALALLAGDTDIDLILSDVVLPGGMNGTEMAQRAQQLRPGLPVLYMSGYTENAIIHNGRLDPGVNLLEKPFTRRQLALAMQAVLGTGEARP